MLRPIVAFILGILVAFVTVALVETLGHNVFPPPAGLGTDRAALAAYIASASPAALAFPLLAWISGAFIGGYVAAFIGRYRHRLVGALIGAFVLAAGALNLIAIPHPTWFVVLALLMVVPAGWLGGNLAARGR